MGYLMGYLGLIFLALLTRFYVRRTLWSWKTRNQKKTRGRYRGGASLGNALHSIQVLAQPQGQHLIEEMLDEESMDEDEEGGPKDPTAHLMRQLKRIRKGEKVDQLVTFLPP
jgi:hypothetical protein